MTVPSMSECGTPSKRSSSLALWLVMLVSLFAVGCGSSGGDDFVVVGNPNNNNPQVPTGAVNFQFTRAQVDVSATVPTATRKLHIDFLNAQNAEVFETSPDVDFAPTVTVNGVPVTATQAVVTALDANGIPVATIFFNISVVANQTTDAVPAGPGFLVTFDSVTASPNPIALAVNATRQIALSLAFSNGSTLSGTAAGGVANYNSSNIAVATVSPSGLVTAKGDGTATITVSYTLNGVTRTTSVNVNVSASGDHGGGTGNVSVNRLIASPTSVTLTNSSTSQKITATFFAANSTTGVPVTATGTLGGFNGGVNATNLTYVSTSGNVTSTAAVNGTATLTLTHTPAGGSAVNATVPVTVSRAAPTGGGSGGGGGGTPARIEATPEAMVVSSGGTGQVTTQFFPANSTVATVLAGSQTSGTFSAPSVTGGETRFAYNNGTVTASGTGGAAAAGEQITLTVFHTPNGTTTPLSDTIRITVGTAAQAGATVSARVASIAPGTTLRLPGAVAANNAANVDFPIVVITTAANGTQAVGNLNGAAGNYAVATASSTAVSLAAAPNAQGAIIVSGNTISTGQPASTTITVSRVADPANGITAATIATIPVVVADTQLASANALTLDTVAALTTRVGQTTTYVVNLNYADGTSQVVTPIHGVASANPATLRVDVVTGADPAAIFAGAVTALAGGATSYSLSPALPQFGFARGDGTAFTAAQVPTQTRSVTVNN